MNKTRTNLVEVVTRISPHDGHERLDMQRTVDWIGSGAEVYRRQRPDVPAQHLAAYVVVVDYHRQSVLLLDHVKAGLWVPTGGHVEPDEDPHQTAVRELTEELGTRAAMVASVAALPLFITMTKTRGAGSHIDVSLWYVAAGDVRMWLEPDQREFRGHRWLTYDEILGLDIQQLDPGMHRFIHKLRERL